MKGTVFPFAAIVGQEQVKLGLLLNVIDPGIGGVLIRGGKGTAKSTAVRALTELLPPVAVTEGCPFSCGFGEEEECPARANHAERRVVERAARLVTLPVGASEERLVGSLDIEAALVRGEYAVRPGLLAEAHRGILYVDEVNLLADHLVDALLDAASMGRNYLERDGVSVSHPARFVLVGTMNPEEGELRPQLLDRFGLVVEAEHGLQVAERAEVVRRRIAYESDPVTFRRQWTGETNVLAGRLRLARELVADVEVPEATLQAIVSVCSACDVEGMRADLAMYRSVRAHAAWHARRKATIEDIRAVAPMVLAHRKRRLPFEQPNFDPREVESALDRLQQLQDRDDDDEPGEASMPALTPPKAPDAEGGESVAPDPTGKFDESAAETGAGRPASIGEARGPGIDCSLPSAGRRSPSGGRHRRTAVDCQHGRQIGARSTRSGGGEKRDIDICATLRAAVERFGRIVPPLERAIWQENRRIAKVAALVVMVVDASGSMGVQRRIEAAKGAVFAVLQDAYLRRDRVAFITFDGKGAHLLLAPTRSVDHAHRALAQCGTGGRTPLWAGLEEAAIVITGARRRDPELPVLLVLVTDGRANLGVGRIDPVASALGRARILGALGVEALVIDTEGGPVRLGISQRIAEAMGGEVVRLDDLEARELWSAVRARRVVVT